MIRWENFKENFNSPLNDLDRVMTKLTNQLMLMQPPEVAANRHKLTELRNLIDRVLDNQQ